jgi:hypothetical protein
MRIIERDRTSGEIVLCAKDLYFLGLSLRSTSKAIQPFEEGRSHIAVWKVSIPDIFTIIKDWLRHGVLATNTDIVLVVNV